MTLCSIHNKFIEAGFKQHPKHVFFKPYADYFYQKAVRDNKGIKYYLNVWVYLSTTVNGIEYPESFTFDAQMDNELEHTFEVETSRSGDFSISDVEDWYWKFWNTMGMKHYELNEPA